MHFALLNCVRPMMKPSILALAMLLCTQPLHAQTALGTAIGYSRSNMKFNGVQLNGTFDFQFKLFDAQTGGNLVAPAITRDDIAVSNGVLKSQLLDFGDGAFNGEARFIDVKARPAGGGQFQTVGPRQAFRPVPYALALPGLFTLQNSGIPSLIGGSASNTIVEDAAGSVICGGGTASVPNLITGNFSHIGGGFDNQVTTTTGSIGGGAGNVVAANRSAIGGGESNEVSGELSFLGGGFDNTVSGPQSAVAGGFTNTASGNASTVGGGSTNIASGTGAAVPGGVLNLAAGNFSFAAGRRAKADADGTFVWADSTNADFFVGGADRFSVRASGGAEIFSSANLSTGVFLSPGGGSWASVSDRAAKTNIRPVDPKAALGKVIHLPVSTWNYTAQDASIRHIGPMAQDFHAAFGVGEDDRHITTIDADGVLFAAVQGLHGMLIERDAQIAQQRREMDELRHRLTQLEQALLNASDRER